MVKAVFGYSYGFWVSVASVVVTVTLIMIGPLGVVVFVVVHSSQIFNRTGIRHAQHVLLIHIS